MPTRKLTEAFESALLRTACESAMEIVGDPDVPPGMASFVDGSREKEERSLQSWRREGR